LLLPLIAAITLVCPARARGERVDINDPTLLGPVVSRTDFGGDYQHLKSEVRYREGVYSYVYAVETNIYFPATRCCRAELVSYAVIGAGLDLTWGAINSSAEFWHQADYIHYQQTLPVGTIAPLRDGFLVMPPRPSERGYTVVYTQSLLPPSRRGAVIYNGVGIEIDPETHEPTAQYGSFRRDGMLAPVPEPASVILFGTGLAALIRRRVASRRRAESSIV